MIKLRVASDCANCPNHREPIKGKGNIKTAEVMVIGDAPERQDVQNKEAFSSGYGKFFLHLVSQAGLNGKSIYFTNAVACASERNSIEEAAEACSSGLLKEIETFFKANGKVIIISGRVALKALGIEGEPLKIRGSFFLKESISIPIIPTFETTYIIKGNMAEQVTAVADIEKAYKVVLHGYEPPKEDFILSPGIKQIEQLVDNAVKNHKVIGIDLETTSLDPRKAGIITVGVALSETEAFSIPFMKKGGLPYDRENYPRYRKALQKLLTYCTCVFHNANFDVSVLMSLGYDVVKDPHDTMLMHHTYHPELPHDLGYVTSIYGRTPYWKGAVLNNAKNMINIDDDELRLYNLRDSVVMMQIYPVLLDELKAADLLSVYDKIARKLIRPTVLMKLNGMRLIESRLPKWKEEVAEALAAAKDSFAALVQAPETFNPNSAYHTSWLFFGKEPKSFKANMKALEEYEVPGCKKKKGTQVYQKLIADTETILKVKPLKMLAGSFSYTPAGNFDLSRKALMKLMMVAEKRIEEIYDFKKRLPKHDEELKELRQVAQATRGLMEYKKWAKLQSTYTEFAIGTDKRIHPSYKIHGTRTGRLASAAPNWQNLPKSVKKLFGPEEGNVMVAADYSNIEMRVLAYETDDEVLQEIFDSGRKIHDENVKIMFGIDKSDPAYDACKKAAKIYIFGRGYGGGLKGIYERVVIQVPELSISYEDFEEIDNAYRSAHPKYVKWVERMEEQAQQRQVKNAFGRVRYFLDPIESVKREILNTPIQGTAADIFNTSLIKVQEWIDEEEVGNVSLIGAVHDSIVLECSREDAVKVAEKLVEIMERKIRLWDKEVSFPVEAEICLTSWAEPVSLEDYKNEWKAQQERDNSRRGRDVNGKTDKLPKAKRATKEDAGGKFRDNDDSSWRFEPNEDED